MLHPGRHRHAVFEITARAIARRQRLHRSLCRQRGILRDRAENLLLGTPPECDEWVGQATTLQRSPAPGPGLLRAVLRALGETIEAVVRHRAGTGGTYVVLARHS